MWYTYVIPPVVGFGIGYFTNYLAIKMLFKPHNPVYVMGVKLPFTPGIIPKEKNRIATAIGTAVSQDLMNREVLEKNLLSDEMIAKIEQGVDSFCAKQQENTENLRSFIAHYLSIEQVDRMEENLSDKFSKKIAVKIAESQLGTKISHTVVAYAIEKMSGGFLGVLGADKLLSAIVEPAERMLSKHIDTILQDHSAEIIDEMVDSQVTELMSTPMCNFFKGKEASIEKGKETIVSFYRSVVSDHLPKILDAIDIQRIIEDRLKEMNMVDLEELILQVMKKELRYIEWIGGGLGALLGLLNIAIL